MLGIRAQGIVVLGVVAAATLAGCASGGGAPCTSAACHDTGSFDGGSFDGGSFDGGSLDGATPDGGLRDADTHAPDLGMPDPPLDGGPRDTGLEDSGRDAFVPLDASATPMGRCPAGEAMTGTSGTTITCAPLAPEITSYVNGSCSIYLGWRDGCGGCALEPTKWGRVSDASCVATGTDSTCQVSTLGGDDVRLFGLNPDGDVDDNDKLYVGFDCAPSSAGGPAVGTACPSGQFVTGTDTSGHYTCAPLGSVAEAAVDQGCWLYLGWQDSCNGCTGAPTKWGRVHGDTCESGAGVGGSCARALLGSDNVMLYGLDFDGDVDGNDTLYLGLQCTGATPAETMAIGACPAGTIATGIGTSGSLVCTSPAQLVETTVNTRCETYLGWADACDACTSTPTKWGRSDGAGTCENGVGVDDVCLATPSTLFGLNTDGDVNDDDKIWVGLHCF